MVEFIAIFNHSFFCNSAGVDLVNYSNVYVLHFYCLSMDWSKGLFSWWYVASNCLLSFTRLFTFLGKCLSAKEDRAGCLWLAKGNWVVRNYLTW